MDLGQTSESVESHSSGAFSEALFIAAVPAVGYAVGFAYESGFAYVFAIPQEFISIGLERVLLASGAVVLLLAVIFHPLNILVATWPKNPGPVARELLPLLPFALLWFAAFFSIGELVGGLLWFGGVILLRAVLNFGIPAITHWHVKGFKAKLEASYIVDANLKFVPDHLTARFGQHALFASVGIAGLLALSWVAGYSSAYREDQFLVVKEPHEAAVLRLYGKHLVAVSFNRDTKTIGLNYMLIPVDQGLVEMAIERVGPLRRP